MHRAGGTQSKSQACAPLGSTRAIVGAIAPSAAGLVAPRLTVAAVFRDALAVNALRVLERKLTLRAGERFALACLRGHR